MHVSIEKRRGKERWKKGDRDVFRSNRRRGKRRRKRELKKEMWWKVEFGDIIYFEATNEGVGEREKEKSEKKRFELILYTFVEPTRLLVEGNKERKERKRIVEYGTNFGRIDVSFKRNEEETKNV